MGNMDYEDITSKKWFDFLVDSCFKFYRRYEILEKHIKLLEDENFNLCSFDCSKWNYENYFEKEYALKTNINNKKFNLPEGIGNIILLNNFEDYFCRDSYNAIMTLNFINRLERIYLLSGKKLIVFLNSNGNSFNEYFSRMDFLEMVGIKSIRWIDGDEPKI